MYMLNMHYLHHPYSCSDLDVEHVVIDIFAIAFSSDNFLSESLFFLTELSYSYYAVHIIGANKHVCF